MRALLVEDDDIFLSIGKEALEEDGDMVVDTAENRDQALERLLNSLDYDVIISDVDLSGDGRSEDQLTNRDGYFFIQFARDRKSRTPLFFYTAKLDESGIEELRLPDERVSIIVKDWMSEEKRKEHVAKIKSAAEDYQKEKLELAKANGQLVQDGIDFPMPIGVGKSVRAAGIRNGDGTLSDRYEDTILLDDSKIEEIAKYYLENFSQKISESTHIRLFRAPLGVHLKKLPQDQGWYAEVHNASSIRAFGKQDYEALEQIVRLIFAIREEQEGRATNVDLQGLDPRDVELIKGFLV